jgi:hypothetical protein
MCKKLIFLTSLVLVLSMAGNASAGVVAHWKFDGNFEDSSGNGHDGTPNGDPVFVPGHFGQALELTGSPQYVNCGSGVSFTTVGDGGTAEGYTISLWINPYNPGGDCKICGDLDDPGWGAAGGFKLALYQTRIESDVRDSSARFFSRSTDGIALEANTWYHVAAVYDDAGDTYTEYINGEVSSSVSVTQGVAASTGDFLIGTDTPSPRYYFSGLLDDLRIYDSALSEQEILGAMQGGGVSYPFASRPAPADGALYEATWVNLGWSPGDSAVSHDVYIGENFDDVNTGAEGTFLGNQAVTNLIIGFPGFAYPEGLVPGTTYYWRIDEVNDTEPNSPWKGKVWSFFIPPRTAYDPMPADGVKFVKPDEELNWTGGFNAKLHYVYFGDDFNDVNNAVVGLPQSDTTYTPGTLELDKVYYWRIDEFDGAATHKGDVWSFSTIPDIAITHPSLVGWWKLDEDMGTTAVDWSGHGNHGTLQGDPQWVPGQVGGALEFDGSGDYVNCGNSPALTITDQITVACWIKVAAFSKSWETILAKGDDSYRMSRGPEFGDSIHFGCNGPTGGNLNATTIVTDDTWHHVALVYDGSNKIIYIDSVEDARLASTGPIDISSYSLYIGENSQATGRHLTGLVDNVRIYNKALTPAEIQLAMRGDPLVAWGSSPANGSTVYIRDATPLNWSPGDSASQHDVYFGTDKGAVADANASDTTGIYRGRQGATTYTPPEGVEWGGGPYYWRVDEYNTDATISKGNVWSFTVADFIVIDDIEDYNDYPPYEIFNTWIDGWEVPTNGSLAGHPDPPFAETGIVHGGGQSMPVYYENNFKYSEITMTLVWPRDWTEEGVGVLSLWFYGDSANAAERMYVNLNGVATVYHDNPDAALIDEWTEWAIDLQEFAAQGVNLANVNTISIGFGDKNNLQAGGSGMVLFDDIRLYRPAPESEPAP